MRYGTNNIGAMYHILFQFQYDMRTKISVEGPLVPELAPMKTPLAVADWPMASAKSKETGIILRAGR